MDPAKRKNAADGYVWAINLLKTGQTTEYVERRGFENPLTGWMEGVDAAIEDWETDQARADNDSEGGEL